MEVGQYIKYSIGDVKFSCHVDAVHAQKPSADMYTGEIVQQVVGQTGVAGIVATISRKEMDINRPPAKSNAPAIKEYREAIRKILDSKCLIAESEAGLTKRYLHIAVHGMRDDHDPPTDFEIGTRHGNSCDEPIATWFRDLLKSHFPSAKIGMNNTFPGDKSKEFHRRGDPYSEYKGYGDNFNTIQVEISRKLRTGDRAGVVAFLAAIVTTFDKRFNTANNVDG
ncbi:N-formylglutamate amidohydrolase [Desulfobacter vibrioformis]|uniref:N-formylglutamate amidohydrolase n=1 Tax=Desulfobacter vibrioformis TaxID=34031 RepID=UPI00068E13E6|nr:N-formylglutamate amidohydrolase [Desulfobacter vibrioformis]